MKPFTPSRCIDQADPDQVSPNQHAHPHPSVQTQDTATHAMALPKRAAPTPAPQLWLFVRHRLGCTEPKIYGFARQCIAVGRAETNEVILSDDRRSVSRRHAELQWDRGQCWIIDLNSKNVTLLNERPLEAGRKYVLRDGDRIGVGDYRIDLFLENPLR